MRVPPTFEIRVALIGYVSVGKTTVLNALFAGKYGEVAMKRTTAVVNNFRVSTPDQGQGSTSDHHDGDVGEDDEDKKEKEAMKWATAVDAARSAGSTLEETIKDNEAHRNSETIIEKTYDVVLNEPLHDMRKDTKLVIVDIPGINEAGTSSKYKDYVNEHWHTFDVAIVVVDGRQGVNTEEQLELIKLIRENTETRKEIPSILLLNKIDDPHDTDQNILLDEFRMYTERIFCVSDRKFALEKMVHGNQPSFFPNNADLRDTERIFCVSDRKFALEKMVHGNQPSFFPNNADSTKNTKTEEKPSVFGGLPVSTTRPSTPFSFASFEKASAPTNQTTFPFESGSKAPSTSVFGGFPASTTRPSTRFSFASFEKASAPTNQTTFPFESGS